MAQSSTPPRQAASPRFVTLVGRIFVALAGLGVLVLWPSERQAIATEETPLDLPGSLKWIISHSALLFHVLWLHAIVTFAAAAGLLRRREWGRRLLIGSLSVAVAYQIIFVGMEWWWSSALSIAMHAAGASISPIADVVSVAWYIRIVSLLTAMVWAGLFGWLVWRLCSVSFHRPFSATHQT